MSTKRPRDEDGDAAAAAPDTKKPRHGFRVGPENLPDGPWRRKVTKIKKDLIHKAKVKKAFAKVKAAEEQEKKAKDTAGNEDEDRGEQEDAEPEAQIHPERQAMLDEREQRRLERGADPDAQDGEDGEQEDGRTHRQRNGGGARRQRRDPRRPGYYDKALEQAEQRKQEAEARAAEAKRREDERNRKVAERDRYRRAMAKARAGTRNGRQRKLGRESGVLLDKVKRLVGQ
ncbi:hypothetical protein UCRPA7_6830 [Phaeoacremonium minimum UCRPA7]|uniref:rRNA-processing protein FYV7 n=1 Tax=Phaeoacremonium minimum (strain UCR-PA7) TaxID=1286976 RepID=R8BED1_PHAM7|nr:hypothetical protein UCRPA7_6830 [Phaeoacremonium minimum UCRPA7]EON97669.1 hypothetical protein UCRPA7_6830 [Phaeoacremonium minimum UCRPA7]